MFSPDFLGFSGLSGKKAIFFSLYFYIRLFFSSSFLIFLLRIFSGNSSLKSANNSISFSIAFEK